MQILVVLGILLFLIEMLIFIYLQEKHIKKVDKELKEIEESKPVNLREVAFREDKWLRQLLR